MLECKLRLEDCGAYRFVLAPLPLLAVGQNASASPLLLSLSSFFLSCSLYGLRLYRCSYYIKYTSTAAGDALACGHILPRRDPVLAGSSGGAE